MVINIYAIGALRLIFAYTNLKGRLVMLH